MLLDINLKVDYYSYFGFKRQSKFKRMYGFRLALAWHSRKLKAKVQTSALLPIINLYSERSPPYEEL